MVEQTGEQTVETIPDRVLDPAPNDYLEVMSRAVFQAGLRWAAIARNWNSYRRAFDVFDPGKVANYTEGDVDRLMREPGILHSERKIRGTIQNAQTFLALAEAYGGFERYLDSFAGYEELSANIRTRFKFMGAMNVWYFLFRVGRPVPRFEHWVETIPGDHPRMKEMVEKARAAGTSTEI